MGMNKHRKNYLTQSPLGFSKALFPWIALLYLSLTWISISYGEVFAQFFWASGSQIFEKQEYWRIFTAIFSHSDFGHFAGNAFLFVPLTYLMLGYFPLMYFISFLLAGLTNVLTLQFYPSQVQLLGSSGWVFVLGGAWISLFLWIDHRERWGRRWGSALFLCLMLFVPDQIQSNVSYLSHFFGFLLGAIVSSLYFLLRKDFFRQFIELEPKEEEELPEFRELFIYEHSNDDQSYENQTSISMPSRERTKSTEENFDRKSKLI